MTNRVFEIARHEYSQNVFRKSFVLVLLSVPLMIAVGVGMGLFIESLEVNNLPVGVVDHAGIFAREISAPNINQKDPVEFIIFPNEDESRKALESSVIQAYYVIDPEYTENRKVTLIYLKPPGDNARRQFFDFLQINLLPELPADVAFRVSEGASVIVRSADGRRVVPPGGPTFGLLMPLFISIAFLGILLITSGYMMGSVVDEKENRTMEILMTSISPFQMISGKVLGIVSIGITLLSTWTLIVVLAINIFRNMGVPWFQNLGMDWRVILMTIAVALPAYVLTTALMTAIGAMSTTTQEGQAISSGFIILHMIPLYVGIAFVNTPHSPLSVILSLLPFTSLMAMAIRNLAVSVPLWQVLVSVLLQSGCALGALWLAGRAFRLGMLQYGQRLNWRQLFKTTESTQRRGI
jgi:ABC-2 type transport system permease protein